MSAPKVVLSKRLKHVLALISPHAAVADVGCDHGYLAIELLQSYKAEYVIAMDVNAGPLARARENRDRYGFSDKIETRLSDGMEALVPGEVQSVVCAGMGGKTICGIIGRSRLLVQTLDELVLQPQSELHIVRRYLRENGFRIAAEDMVLEDGKFYPMMRVVPICQSDGKSDGAEGGYRADGESPEVETEGGCHADGESPEVETEGGCHADGESSDADAEQRQRVEDWYGPCLLAEKHPVLQRYLQKEKAVCTQILHNLEQADSEKGTERRQELLQRLSDIAFAERMG